jgi:hypothetical protein
VHHLVVHPEAVHQGGHRVTHRGDVDHQGDGGAQGGGDRGRTVDLGLPGQAVEQAHRALDHGELCARRTVREQRCDPLRADQARIQVAARTAGGQAEVGRVRVIRSDLETGGRDTAGRAGGEQPDGDRRLPVTGRRRAHDQARQGGHRQLPRVRTTAGG